MSDVKKLEKQLEKAIERNRLARQALDGAVDDYSEAAGALAVARDALEQAEALEAARELRGKR
jgi:hypothetical protein